MQGEKMTAKVLSATAIERKSNHNETLLRAAHLPATKQIATRASGTKANHNETLIRAPHTREIIIIGKTNHNETLLRTTR